MKHLQKNTNPSELTPKEFYETPLGNDNSNDMKSFYNLSVKHLALFMWILFTIAFNSCDKENCDYTETFDCEELQSNIGDPCDSDGNGTLNGTISEDCECIPNYEVITECPGFIENGDFEDITGDPNAVIDQDIDLANHWGPLWARGSLADLFDASTTNFGSSSFLAPTPPSGVFAGMWIENFTNPNGRATFREGMFTDLATNISANTGNYTLNFNYAKMSTAASNDVKVGIYGVHYSSGTLPPNPIGAGNPTNLDLFGSGSAVLLGEVTISNSTTNTWVPASFSFDSASIALPSLGPITHIMITHTHNPLPDFGRMFLGFDDFCLIND